MTEGGPHLTIFAGIVPTSGAPSLVFLVWVTLVC
jgi:hypothetical protein